jgi:hypothetical protein
MAEDTDANLHAESRSSWRDQERRRLAVMKAGKINGYVVERGAYGDVERRTVNRGDKDFPKTRQGEIRRGEHTIKQMTGKIAEMRRKISSLSTNVSPWLRVGFGDGDAPATGGHCPGDRRSMTGGNLPGHLRSPGAGASEHAAVDMAAEDQCQLESRFRSAKRLRCGGDDLSGTHGATALYGG